MCGYYTSVYRNSPVTSFWKPGLTQTLKRKNRSLLWWLMPLILALWRQRQEDLCKFKASLVYKVSSRTAWADTQRNPVSK